VLENTEGGRDGVVCRRQAGVRGAVVERGDG